MCERSYCVPEPKWGCLGERFAPSGNAGPFEVTLHVQHIVSKQPLSGVTARLCRKLDVKCENPQGSEVMSGEDGLVRLTVKPEDPAAGFTGYVQLTRDDLMPGLYFFSPAVDRPVDVPVVQMLSPSIATVLTEQVGTTFDRGRGIVLLGTYDCMDRAAAGVTLSGDYDDAQSAAFYSVDGLPAVTATATDDNGYGGMINVPPGTISITGRIEEDRRVLGTISVLVKPGSITFSRLVPIGT